MCDATGPFASHSGQMTGLRQYSDPTVFSPTSPPEGLPFFEWNVILPCNVTQQHCCCEASSISNMLIHISGFQGLLLQNCKTANHWKCMAIYRVKPNRSRRLRLHHQPGRQLKHAGGGRWEKSTVKEE